MCEDHCHLSDNLKFFKDRDGRSSGKFSLVQQLGFLLGPDQIRPNNQNSQPVFPSTKVYGQRNIEIGRMSLRGRSHVQTNANTNINTNINT